MDVRRIGLNAASLAVGGVVAQLCFISIEAVIARSLGQEAYGVYGTVYALSLAVVVIADAGMSAKLLESGSREPATISWLFGTTVLLKLGSCIAIYPLALLLLTVAGYDQAAVSFFAIFFGYAVLLVAQDTLASTYSARQRMHVNAFFQGLSPVAILLFIQLAMWWSPALTSLGYAYLAGAGLVTAIWAVNAARNERPRVQLDRTKEILAGSYHYGVTAVLFQIFVRLDLMLLPLWTSFSQIGLFAAADKLADLGMKVGVMGTRVVAPVLFAQSVHDVEVYRRTVKAIVRAISVFGVSGCLVLAVLAEPLLSAVFGANFGAASLVLVLLALSLGARLIAMVLQTILSASSGHTRRTLSLGAGVTAAAAANVLLIPLHGILGAAIARIVGDYVLLTAMITARELPVRRRQAAIWVFGPLLVGAVAFLAASRLATSTAAELAASLAIYAAALLTTRMIGAGDLRALKDGMRAGKKPAAT